MTALAEGFDPRLLPTPVRRRRGRVLLSLGVAMAVAFGLGAVFLLGSQAARRVGTPAPVPQQAIAPATPAPQATNASPVVRQSPPMQLAATPAPAEAAPAPRVTLVAERIAMPPVRLAMPTRAAPAPAPPAQPAPTPPAPESVSPKVAPTPAPTMLPAPTAVPQAPPSGATEPRAAELAVQTRPGSPAAPVAPAPATPPGATPAAASPAPPSGPAWPATAANGLPLPPPEKPPTPESFASPPTVADLAALVEETSAGKLPRIAPSGAMPWLAHAMRFNHADQRPRIGVVMVGLGLDEALTIRAIDRLPPQISLAFWASAPNLESLVRRARDRGHEVVLILPVETPKGAGDSALPGGLAPISAEVEPVENVRRLHRAMARAGQYVGVMIPVPGPASESERAIRPVVREVGDRGLLVLETFRTSRSAVQRLTEELGAPYSTDVGAIDRPDANEIERNLALLETFTKERRFALAIASPSAATIDKIAAWAGGVEARGLALAPLSALSECRARCKGRVERMTQSAAAGR